MAINTTPVFTGKFDIQWGAADGDGGTAGPLKTANTNQLGTGTVLTVFTANATNGGFVKFIRVKHAGTNIASVLRIFINNGSTNTVAANNSLYEEIPLHAVTLTESDVMSPSITLPLNFFLPAGYRIFVTVGTTIAAGVLVSVVGGDLTAGTANATPVYGKFGDVQWGPSIITSANTAFDGTGSNTSMVFVADGTNGGYIRSLRCTPVGTNAGPVALRVFINNGSAHTSALNNLFFTEGNLQNPTTSAVAVTGTVVDVPLNIHLPAGYGILVTIATGVTNGWAITAIGSKF